MIDYAVGDAHPTTPLMGKFYMQGLIFTVGIILSSLYYRVVIASSGMFIPLSWNISYFSSLIVAFILSFTLTLQKVKWTKVFVLESVLIAVLFGLITGYFVARNYSSGVGYDDLKRGGKLIFEIVGSSVYGTLAGLGLGRGNAIWPLKYLEKGMKNSSALITSLLAAILCISVAFCIAIS